MVCEVHARGSVGILFFISPMAFLPCVLQGGLVIFWGILNDNASPVKRLAFSGDKP